MIFPDQRSASSGGGSSLLAGVGYLANGKLVRKTGLMPLSLRRDAYGGGERGVEATRSRQFEN